MRAGAEYREALRDGRPWCLHLSYIKPHWPYIAPAPYHAMYGEGDVLPALRVADERADPHPVYAALMAMRPARSFARKLIDIDYHIAMGGNAYSSLADTLQRSLSGRCVAGVYAQLAQKFQGLVDALNEVSEMSYRHTDADILRLYEMWMKTGSPRAHGLLRQLGVQPVAAGGARREH